VITAGGCKNPHLDPALLHNNIERVIMQGGSSTRVEGTAGVPPVTLYRPYGLHLLNHHSLTLGEAHPVKVLAVPIDTLRKET